MLKLLKPRSSPLCRRSPCSLYLCWPQLILETLQDSSQAKGVLESRTNEAEPEPRRNPEPMQTPWSRTRTPEQEPEPTMTQDSDGRPVWARVSRRGQRASTGHLPWYVSFFLFFLII